MKPSPNILVIVADQLSWKALPAYGNQFLNTPNIDRIFNRGVRFENAYSPCPLCQPARAALWTGLLPHRTGVLSNGRNHPVEPVSDTVPTLGSVFAQGGYRTIHFGKTHAAGGLRGFEVVPEEEIPVEESAPWPLNADTFKDRGTSKQAVEFLERYEGNDPFLAVADFNNPHNICGWVGENVGLHQDSPIDRELPPLPENFYDPPLTDRPFPVRYLCCSHRRQAQAVGWNETNYRHYLAAYYHYVELLDAEIGRVLDAVEKRNNFENTFLVFFSDHGDGMGAHGIVTKHTSLHEESTRVPLVFTGPGISADDQPRQPLVSLLDLVPTLCDLAGLQFPDTQWGRSLTPLISSPTAEPVHSYVSSEWHTEWGFTIEPGRMIRTCRYKYICYREEGGEEFYDIDADPGETRNLANDPEYAADLDEHRQILARHVDETADPFFTLSAEVDPCWRAHSPGFSNHSGPSASGI